MKKLKATLAKSQMFFRELVLRQSTAVESSILDHEMDDHAAVDFEKAILDIRMKSYQLRKFNF